MSFLPHPLLLLRPPAAASSQCSRCVALTYARTCCPAPRPAAPPQAPCTAGRVVFQVWSTDQYGDDYLVGQAELGLGPMLAAERPHPLATTLELQVRVY